MPDWSEKVTISILLIFTFLFEWHLKQILDNVKSCKASVEWQVFILLIGMV